jgi:hypothetical protein
MLNCKTPSNIVVIILNVLRIPAPGQRHYIGRLCKRMWMRHFNITVFSQGPQGKEKRIETGLIAIGTNSNWLDHCESQ